MRISTGQIFNIASNSLADANEAILKTQEQLSTGQRVLNPSDDPVASTKIMALTDEVAAIDQYQNNISIAKNNLVLEESVLSSVNNLIQRIQELAVQAGNTAVLSESDYSSLSNEVDSRIDELKNLLNTQNANGDYIFGGYKSQSEPFSGNNYSGFTYHGDEGQQFIKIANGTSVAASDSGKTIFQDIVSANNTVYTYASPANRSDPPVSISVGQIYDQEAYDEFYPEDMTVTFNLDSDVAPAGKNFTITEKSTGHILVANQRYVPGEELQMKGVSFRITGNPASAEPGVPGDRLFIESTEKQDILTTFSRFSEAMKNYDKTPEALNSLSGVVNSTIANLDNAQTSVLEVTSKLGARYNTLDSTESLHVDSKLVTQQLLSDLRDVDYAEAATQLSQQSLILQAAQSSFLRVSQLTLFSQL